MGESAEAAGTGSGGGGSDDTPAVCCGVGAGCRRKQGIYYTVEAVYRLLLLGDTFSRYLHILYLDCNLIVNGDVSRLYDTELGEAEIAVVSAEEFMVLSKTKRAVFFGGYPYNVDNYRTDALGMTGIIMLVLCVACFMGCDQKDVEDQVRNVTDSVDEHVIGVKTDIRGSTANHIW